MKMFEAMSNAKHILISDTIRSWYHYVGVDNNADRSRGEERDRDDCGWPGHLQLTPPLSEEGNTVFDVVRLSVSSLLRCVKKWINLQSLSTYENIFR